MEETIIAVLATFWLTIAVVKSDGPFLLFARLRSKISLFRCTICTSFWIALIVVGLAIVFKPLVIIMAIAGLATLLGGLYGE